MVTPLILQWHRFLQSKLSHEMLKNLIANHNKWETLVTKMREGESTPDERKKVVSTHDEPNDIEDDPTNVTGDSEMLLPGTTWSISLNQLLSKPENREEMQQKVAGARNKKLIRQTTFPALGPLSNDNQMLRSSSHEDCSFPLLRTIKSASGIRLEADSESRLPEGKFERLREHLSDMYVNLGYRRKSIPAQTEPLSKYLRLKVRCQIINTLLYNFIVDSNFHKITWKEEAYEY